jgi:cytidyltransferase-like protein
MGSIVLVTGGFDPIHSGHIAYFKAAKQLGSKLIVGVNSDAWLTRKKGRPFMPWTERANIIKELSVVDDVIEFDDSDGSANFAIYKCLQQYPNSTVIFANGGDRTPENIPEFIYKNTPWVRFVFGVGGGDKKNSSSWILEEWKNPKTKRLWGWYRVLDDKPGYKVKELVIEPGKSLSDQRHFFRSEHWYVLKGTCNLKTEVANGGVVTNTQLTELTTGYVIPVNTWHQASNPTDEPCHILEVQYGEKCIEDDIERRE